MKTVSTALILSIALLFILPQSSHAQLGGLKDRLKKRAERKIERTIEERTVGRLENELNRAIDRSVENMADGIESSIEGMIFSSEPAPPIELGPNATGAANAPYVTYTIATRMQIGGNDMASRLLQRFGSQDQVVYTHGNKQRTDESEESSQIMDADGKQIIHLDHKKKEWMAMSFEDMFNSIEEMKAEASESARESEVSTNVDDVNVSVDRTGKTETINGVSATQVITTIEASYETTVQEDEENEEFTMSGTMHLIMDTWQSKEVAGIETIASFHQAMAGAMGAAMAGTGFESMLSALQSSPGLQEAAEDASNRLKPEDGLPVRTITYYVQVPEGGTFDPGAVLSGETSGSPDELSQRVIMTVQTEVGNLSTEPFDESMMAPPADYSQRANPMQK